MSTLVLEGDEASAVLEGCTRLELRCDGLAPRGRCFVVWIEAEFREAGEASPYVTDLLVPGALLYGDTRELEQCCSWHPDVDFAAFAVALRAVISDFVLQTMQAA